MNWAMIIAGIAVGVAWYFGGVARDMDRYLHGDYADWYCHAGDASWADDDDEG